MKSLLMTAICFTVATSVSLASDVSDYALRSDVTVREQIANQISFFSWDASGVTDEATKKEIRSDESKYQIKFSLYIDNPSDATWDNDLMLVRYAWLKADFFKDRAIKKAYENYGVEEKVIKDSELALKLVQEADQKGYLSVKKSWSQTIPQFYHLVKDLQYELNNFLPLAERINKGDVIRGALSKVNQAMEIYEKPENKVSRWAYTNAGRTHYLKSWNKLKVFVDKMPAGPQWDYWFNTNDMIFMASFHASNPDRSPSTLLDVVVSLRSDSDDSPIYSLSKTFRVPKEVAGYSIAKAELLNDGRTLRLTSVREKGWDAVILAVFDVNLVANTVESVSVTEVPK